MQVYVQLQQYIIVMELLAMQHQQLFIYQMVLMLDIGTVHHLEHVVYVINN
jgi:hypothetical protein